MATVYKAYDRSAGSVVLLKRLHAADPERRRRFEAEAALAADVEHPNVVRVLHVGDGALVAEWVEGTDLGGLVEAAGAVPAGLAAFVAREAARGLEAVHAAGILHRDVAPGNVLVGLDGAVKLTDFGLASLGETGPGGDGAEVRGTLGTLAPEVVRGEAPGPRSDLFSLGAVLAHMLTGRAPFAGAGTSATLDAVLHGDAAAALADDPRVPPALTEVAAALLAKAPGDRPASAADAADRLDAALEALGGPGADDLAAFLEDPAGYRPPPVAARPPAPEAEASRPTAGVPPARRRPRWPVAVAVLGIVSAAVALALTLDPGPEPVAVEVEPEPPGLDPVEIAPTEDAPPPLEAEADPPRGLEAPPPRDAPETDATASGPAPLDVRRPDPGPPDTPEDPPAPRTAPDRAPEAAPQPGTLVLEVAPSATVRVNGQTYENVTDRAIPLPPGDYTVTLSNPTFPVSQTVAVSVPPGGRVERRVQMMDAVAEVSFDVKPWAYATVNGRRLPDAVDRGDEILLAPGSYEFVFTNPAFESPVTRRVRVAAGDREVVSATMGREAP